jgi:peptide/nickel transport system substrate-binding protein
MTLAFALVATVTFASGEGEEAAAVEKEMVLDPSTGEMVTAPEYGGTIRAVVNFKNEGIDPYYRYTAGAWIGLVNEKLGRGDWAIDRSVFGYNTTFLPLEALAGLLAESWESPDPLTYVFKIRDGVFWHDKAPVNGRQLTAHDVAYSWQRLLFGVDGGEPSPDCPGGFDICNTKWESVAATDDSTVVFKLQEPSVTAFSRMLVAEHGYIVAREVVDEFGDIQDWRNVTGTGPFQLTDVVEGSSWTYTKIDDYWGFDPKFPDNRLPYADTIEFLVVNDPTAITSLMRSGQADWIGFGLNSHLTSVDSAVNLQKTKPDLVLHPYSYRSETAFGFNLQKEPWSDIRVRQALSLAIDHESIAENYQQGWGDASPQGATGARVLGYAVPFEEWPEETQQYYRYDPEEAERLLDEAGYPRGEDGIRFSTIYSHYEFFDLGYYQIAMDYLRQIGIDVEIQVILRATHQQKGTECSANPFDCDYLGLRTDVHGAEYPIAHTIIQDTYSEAGWRDQNVIDAEFDGYFENMLAATTVEEQQEWARKANLRLAEQLVVIRGPIAPLFGATQPWLKGYNGEGELGRMNRAGIFQYLWIDQDLKRELGF